MRDTHLKQVWCLSLFAHFMRKFIKLIKNKSGNTLEYSCLLWHRLPDVISFKENFLFLSSEQNFPL